MRREERGCFALVQDFQAATADVDVNVFVEETDLTKLFAALESLGVTLDPEAAAAAAHADGLIVVFAHGIRVDLFVPSIEFSWEACRTRRGVPIDGHTIYFLAPTALAVFKMLFFRPKDLVDLDRLLALQAREALDREYVRAHLVEMVGEHDERVDRWDALVRADVVRRGG